MTLTSTGKLLADRYRVLGRLGAGGMATVVLAEDERLGRKVAVKRLHAESADDAARRFEREAKVGASLNHPNIVAVYDTVADDEGVLIVMEYVDGHTLRVEMDRGPMEPSRAIEVLWGVAAGLDHAHAHGVVHRDVKPANVLIAAGDGAVKLTDLGIATAAERTQITHTGMVLGTAAYMAPERLDGQAGGAPVDVYATAALAFEMLSGRKAFTGRTAVEVAHRVVTQPPPVLTDVLPDAPPRAAGLLAQGMAKDPAERPASAGALVRELSAAYAEAALERPPTGPTRPITAAAPPPPPPRKRPPAVVRAPARRPAWLVPAALLAVAAVVVAIAVAGSSGGGGKQPHRGAAAGSGHKKRPSGNGAKPATPTSAAPAPSTSAAPVPPTSAAPAPPAAAGAGSPTAALSSFYTRAASHDPAGAWALGTDRLHGQFGSFGAFASTFRSLQSISFPSMQVTSQAGGSATVAFSSVAQHADHTDRCTAQASLLSQGGQWLVDHLDAVNCASSNASGKPKQSHSRGNGHGGQQGGEQGGGGE